MLCPGFAVTQFHPTPTYRCKLPLSSERVIFLLGYSRVPNSHSQIELGASSSLPILIFYRCLSFTRIVLTNYHYKQRTVLRSWRVPEQQ